VLRRGCEQSVDRSPGGVDRGRRRHEGNLGRRHLEVLDTRQARALPGAAERSALVVHQGAVELPDRKARPVHGKHGTEGNPRSTGLFRCHRVQHVGWMRLGGVRSHARKNSNQRATIPGARIGLTPNILYFCLTRCSSRSYPRNQSWQVSRIAGRWPVSSDLGGAFASRRKEDGG
jgi:hypothetical protein